MLKVQGTTRLPKKNDMKSKTLCKTKKGFFRPLEKNNIQKQFNDFQGSDNFLYNNEKSINTTYDITTHKKYSIKKTLVPPDANIKGSARSISHSTNSEIFLVSRNESAKLEPHNINEKNSYYKDILKKHNTELSLFENKIKNYEKNYLTQRFTKRSDISMLNKKILNKNFNSRNYLGIDSKTPKKNFLLKEKKNLRCSTEKDVHFSNFDNYLTLKETTIKSYRKENSQNVQTQKISATVNSEKFFKIDYEDSTNPKNFINEDEKKSKKNKRASIKTYKSKDLSIKTDFSALKDNIQTTKDSYNDEKNNPIKSTTKFDVSKKENLQLKDFLQKTSLFLTKNGNDINPDTNRPDLSVKDNLSPRSYRDYFKNLIGKDYLEKYPNSLQTVFSDAKAKYMTDHVRALLQNRLKRREGVRKVKNDSVYIDINSLADQTPLAGEKTIRNIGKELKISVGKINFKESQLLADQRIKTHQNKSNKVLLGEDSTFLRMKHFYLADRMSNKYANLINEINSGIGSYSNGCSPKNNADIKLNVVPPQSKNMLKLNEICKTSTRSFNKNQSKPETIQDTKKRESLNLKEKGKFQEVIDKNYTNKNFTRFNKSVNLKKKQCVHNDFLKLLNESLTNIQKGPNSKSHVPLNNNILKDGFEKVKKEDSYSNNSMEDSKNSYQFDVENKNVFLKENRIKTEHNLKPIKRRVKFDHKHHLLKNQSACTFLLHKKI